MPDPDFSWSTDIDADVVAIVEQIVAASAAPTTSVHAGRAPKGAQPPFVCCWPLEPQVDGVGLGAESWGRADQQWQLSPHGATFAQARYLAEQLCGSLLWPAGWELVDIGTPVPDETDTPATLFWPLTFVYRGHV